MIGYFLIIFFVFFIIIFIFNMKVNKYKSKSGSKKIENKNEIPYFRDIPFDNLGDALWVGIHYNIIENISDFIGAMILKWVKEDKIDIIEINGETALDMNKIFKTDDEFETQIYLILLGGCGPNRILESKELEHLFNQNNKNINELFHKLEYTIKESLITRGYLKRTYLDEYFTKEKLEVTPYLDECAKRLIGLKKFLLDFSNIENKESTSIHLWDDYLIYAQLLGITDKVSSELKSVYPDYEEFVKIKSFKASFGKALALSLALTLKLTLGSFSRD